MEQSSWSRGDSGPDRGAAPFPGEACNKVDRAKLVVKGEEKEKTRTENEKNKELLDFMKEKIGDVYAVKLSSTLGKHPVSLSSEGEFSVEMEKILSKMPGADKSMLKAKTVLEINNDHEIATKLKLLFTQDKEKVEKWAKILYAQARLINGLEIENPLEISALICELM